MELVWVTNHSFEHPYGTYDHDEWANQFIVGSPKATERFSVEELENMGLVGLYREVKSTERVYL